MFLIPSVFPFHSPHTNRSKVWWHRGWSEKFSVVYLRKVCITGFENFNILWNNFSNKRLKWKFSHFIAWDSNTLLMQILQNLVWHSFLWDYLLRFARTHCFKTPCAGLSRSPIVTASPTKRQNPAIKLATRTTFIMVINVTSSLSLLGLPPPWNSDQWKLHKNNQKCSSKESPKVIAFSLIINIQYFELPADVFLHRPPSFDAQARKCLQNLLDI